MSSKKVSVILSYASKGAQPPIFIAGSFSEPAWDPQEMHFTVDDEGEHHFYKKIEVEEGGEFQYKFRIGLGDWWALNEEAPTVIDVHGNRNNHLLVPGVEAAIETSQSSESTRTAAKTLVTVPELVVEKVDDEPRYGDDFGPEATTGQKDAHQMRALDAEPDNVLFQSQSSTSLYANTAAEVADSAAILDRQPSPAPVPDEEAGRTGERRISTTPIPQVALTAAEVADIAAMLDQPEDSEDDSSILMPLLPHESDLGDTTPWHEQVPLFAHERLVPNDGVEIESPITSDSLGSPIKADPVREVVDLNDPLLERFPEDRLSILTHIRSCESRMSEDETNVQGVPPSPITRAKSRSPSTDAPGSARLDAQPSPSLDVITEEHQEGGYFDNVVSPTQKLNGNGRTRVPDELNVIEEAEEPIEEPKDVLENLRKIEESTPDCNDATVKSESLQPEVDENAPVGISNMMNEQDMRAAVGESVQNLTDTKVLLNNSSDEVQSGQPAVGVQTGLKGDSVETNQHKASEQLFGSSHISQSVLRFSGTSRAVQDVVPNPSESPDDSSISGGRESDPRGGNVPEVKMEPKEELEMQKKSHLEESDIRLKNDTMPDSEHVHANKHGDIRNDVIVGQRSILQHSEPVSSEKAIVTKVLQSVDSTGCIPGDKYAEEGLKNIGNPIGGDLLEEQKTHIDSFKTEQHLAEQSQEVKQSTELKQADLEHVNGILKGQALMQDLPIDGRVESQSAVEASNTPGMIAEHVLDGNTQNLEDSTENAQRETASPTKSIAPVSKINFEHADTQVTGQDALVSDMQKSVIEVKDLQMNLEGSTQADLPTALQTGNKTTLSQQENMPGLESQALAATMKVVPEEASPTTQKDEMPAATLKVDEQDSDKSAELNLQSKVDKPAVVVSRPRDVDADHEESQPNSMREVDGVILATHVKSAKSDVGNDDGMLQNEVDAGNSKCDDHSSAREDDKTSTLDPPSTSAPKIERPLTPSSIRSPVKVVESENLFKSIWRTLFVDWIGGIFASLCGGDRGPLVAISMVVIIGPVLAMYFFSGR